MLGYAIKGKIVASHYSSLSVVPYIAASMDTTHRVAVIGLNPTMWVPAARITHTGAEAFRVLKVRSFIGVFLVIV